MFRAVPLPINRSPFTLHSAILCVVGFVDRFRAGPGYSILVLFESCLQTCMTYTIAKCTVNKLLMMGKGTARNM